MGALALAAAPTPDLHAALPLLAPLLDALECGVIVAGTAGSGNILFANPAIATLVGRDPHELVGMGAAAFSSFVATLVDNPPEIVRAGRILPMDARIVCEEFEILRPERSVVRWVARRLSVGAETLLLATCTDITAEVDLAEAHERLAHTDRLTGLMNRRGFEAALRRDVARARRQGAPVSFLLVDVDHFKRVNDTKGHAAGDLVLRQVGRCLVSVVRTSDAVGRWGGEEFIAALPGTDLESARQCAERVRHAVERLSPDSGPVTVSVGVSALERDEEVAAAIARADARLYLAKSNGRNRVE